MSKLLVFRLHYDVIREKYGEKVKLLFTDNDYMCYHVEP
jgi:hypothetical protein